MNPVLVGRQPVQLFEERDEAGGVFESRRSRFDARVNLGEGGGPQGRGEGRHVLAFSYWLLFGGVRRLLRRRSHRFSRQRNRKQQCGDSHGFTATLAGACFALYRANPSSRASSSSVPTRLAPPGNGCMKSAVTRRGCATYQRAMVPWPPIA